MWFMWVMWFTWFIWFTSTMTQARSFGVSAFFGLFRWFARSTVSRQYLWPFDELKFLWALWCFYFFQTSRIIFAPFFLPDLTAFSCLIWIRYRIPVQKRGHNAGVTRSLSTTAATAKFRGHHKSATTRQCHCDPLVVPVWPLGRTSATTL